MRNVSVHQVIFPKTPLLCLDFGYDTVSYIVGFQLILLLLWSGCSFIFLDLCSADDGKTIEVVL